MFNVSALLLDDPLKPATPLTNGAINETLRHTLDISQGNVATNLRCSGTLRDGIITNFLLILTVNLAKLRRTKMVLFLGHLVYLLTVYT